MNRRHAIYNWLRANPFKVDLTAAVLLLGLLAPIYLVAGRPREFLFSCALIMPLAWRRVRPGYAAAVVVLACLIQWALAQGVVAGQIAVPLVIYATAAYGPSGASRAVLALGLLGGVMMPARLYSVTPGIGFLGLTVGALYTVLIWLLVLVSWTIGDLTRVRRRQLQALEDRARRLEIEHQQERQLAAADERSHIAREMHDIVAHSLSVIITQADGARYAAAANPVVATEALATIAGTGRSSLGEMRRLLGVLRSDEASPTRPQPGMADLDELLLSFRAAGLQVSFEQSGTPRRHLPPGAELTAYRVVQEALTNVIKHAGPLARATTSLEWQSRGLQIDVHDDGRGAAADPSRSAGGKGLLGMAERISLYDGSLAAGPATGGGFHISATIPYSEA